MDEHLLVTGSGGFIGGRLITALRPDFDVRGVDIVRNHWVDVTASVLHLDQLQAVFPPSTTVVHLAGPVVESTRKQPFWSMDLQLRGTLNVLEAARLCGVRRVILASSFYVYDGCDPETVVDERTPLDVKKMEPFSAAKLMSERLLQQYHDAYGLETLALRFGSVYGWGDCSNVIKTFLELGEAHEPIVIWGRGRRRNQYTYVDDVVDGIARCIRQNTTGTYNLISPQETTTGALAALLRQMHQYEVIFDEDRPEGASMAYMSSRHAMADLGWAPMPLNRGISQMITDMQLAGRESHADR